MIFVNRVRVTDANRSCVRDGGCRDYNVIDRAAVDRHLVVVILLEFDLEVRRVLDAGGCDCFVEVEFLAVEVARQGGQPMPAHPVTADRHAVAVVAAGEGRRHGPVFVAGIVMVELQFDSATPLQVQMQHSFVQRMRTVSAAVHFQPPILRSDAACCGR